MLSLTKLFKFNY